MKIAITSDWHGYLLPEDFIPDCDLMIVAGDIGIGERFSEEVEVLLTDRWKWMENLPFPIVAIAGNHDFPKQVEILRHLPWIYIEDETVEIEGLKIFGTPWSNPFGYGWAYNMEEEDQTELFDRLVPDDIDIIISHGPPKGYRDTVSYFDGIAWVNKNVGSEALRKRMEQLKNLKLLACGHIHPAYGQTEIVVNGCLVNNKYKIANKPIIMEV